MKLNYTICFIRQGDHLLLLNRNQPAWMGCWNGVGGKLEPDETPETGIIREVFEETGIRLERASFKGVVTWLVDGEREGGMYLFMAELPRNRATLETPIKTEEGILDWKPIDWIMHPANTGVASNIPRFLPAMLRDDRAYRHHCVFENGRLTQFESTLYTPYESLTHIR